MPKKRDRSTLPQKTAHVVVRTKREDRELIDRAARKSRETVSDFARRALVSAARSALEQSGGGD